MEFSSVPGRISSKTSLNLNNYKDQSKKTSVERKRNILHLIWKYLNEHNLTKSADCLENETEINTQYEVCDNIDLEVILQEYQSYYSVKFQKEPKILRKIAKINDSSQKSKKTKLKSAKTEIEKEKNPQRTEERSDSFEFEIISLGNSNLENTQSTSQQQSEPSENPLNFVEYSSDCSDLIDLIKHQIVPKNLGITWKDCIGLEPIIELIKEATIYPMKYPQLFENISNWAGILLYGPPGTGKTLLAKALASEQDLTIINVTGSTFISKWRGESEKLVKTLFQVAKMHNPSVIFIDEIDSLINSTENNQHEASRRFKSEFLTQIDGLLSSNKVFVLATTNHPWILDQALIRRFEKRILVDLPNNRARNSIINHYLNKFSQTDWNCKDLEEFSNLTCNYSAADIKTVCKEVKMALIREKIHEIKIGGNRKLGKNRQVTVNDITKAINQSNSSVDQDLYEKCLKWDCKFTSK